MAVGRARDGCPGAAGLTGPGNPPVGPEYVQLFSAQLVQIVAAARQSAPISSASGNKSRSPARISRSSSSPAAVTQSTALSRINSWSVHPHRTACQRGSRSPSAGSRPRSPDSPRTGRRRAGAARRAARARARRARPAGSTRPPRRRAPPGPSSRGRERLVAGPGELARDKPGQAEVDRLRPALVDGSQVEALRREQGAVDLGRHAGGEQDSVSKSGNCDKE